MNIGRRIIMLSGNAGSGKDTAYLMLEELVGDLPRYSFADPMKEICADVFNMSISYFYDPMAKDSPWLPVEITKEKFITLLCKYGLEPNQITHSAISSVGRVMKTPRELLQVVGTDILRDIDPQIHIKKLLSVIEAPACVTDVRFANELSEVAKKFEIIPIHIKRSNVIESDHVSERLSALEAASTVVRNDWTKEDLKYKLEEVLKEYAEDEK